MARRSLRHQVASTSTTPKKRAASPETPTSTKLPRRSKPSGSSAASQKVTAKKSRYFTKGSDEDELAESASEDSQDAASNYEATDDVASASADGEDEDEDEDEDEYESDADSKPKKRGRPKQTNGMVRVVGAKGQEMWRTGVKTGLDPGQEVYIELPKARKPGKTPYKDETIHPNTFLFLKDLANNNDREWLKMHDADYRAAQKDWNSFVEKLTEQVIEKDDTIPELPVKDIVFRIYRDIRFSPDPTPYKTYFSAAWSRTGRKGPYAGYYVQIQPGGTFVGGGLWMPEAQALASLRRDVDRKSHKIKSVLTNAGLRKEFFGGIPKNEKNAVRAFIGQNTENALKTKPKGYDSDNPNIDILRLRNYTVGKKLRDDEVMGPGGLNRIAELIGNLTPFITYLNSVVMPDGEESDENEDGEDEDGEDEDGEDEDGEDEDGEDDGGAEEGEGDGEEEKD